MEIIKTPVLPNDCVVYDMSDLHVGSPNCALQTLAEVISEIKAQKNAYCLVKGDAIECILPNDKRYLHTAVMDEYKTPAAQADKVIEMFTPIKDRILAWGMGNHCYKLLNTIDLAKYMADRLDTPYGSYNFKLHWMFKDGLGFKTYHTHGMGGVNSNAKDDIQYEANRKAGLKHKLVKSGIGDCIYMSRGHDHQLIVVEPTVGNKLYLTDDGNGIHQHYHVAAAQDAQFIAPDSRWYATTGSFRKLYTKPGLMAVDYSELAGVAPSEIGFAKMHIQGGKLVAVTKEVR